MTQLATPSAKSHERVTGRWNRDLHAENKRDWTVYYLKLAFGTPVPTLLIGFVIALFVSRAAVEIFAWAGAVLTMFYVIADRFAREREFEFWRAGSDLLLAGFLIVSVVGIAQTSDPDEIFLGLGTLRWIPLLYLFLYAWQLFPGLNRMFMILCACAGLTAIYAIVQHFVGIDVIRGMEQLPYAPIKGYAYFIPVGFFRHSEILGTVLAFVLPFPIAAIMQAEERERGWVTVVALAMMCVLTLAVLWTYKPGLWVAASAGIAVTMLLQPRRHLLVFVVLGALLSGTLFAAYGEPDVLFNQVRTQEIARGERQRQQINKQLAIWNEHPVIGAGMKSAAVRSTESLDGNVYFELLAQTGTVGLILYLLFALNFLLGVYRIWREIPKSHYWHKVLCTAGVGSLASFHVAGLYWPTLSDSHALLIYVFLLSALSYLIEQYDRGLVPDDHSL